MAQIQKKKKKWQARSGKRDSSEDTFHISFNLFTFYISLSPFLDVTTMSMSTVSFLAQLGSGILCL